MWMTTSDDSKMAPTGKGPKGPGGKGPKGPGGKDPSGKGPGGKGPKGPGGKGPNGPGGKGPKGPGGKGPGGKPSGRGPQGQPPSPHERQFKDTQGDWWQGRERRKAEEAQNKQQAAQRAADALAADLKRISKEIEAGGGEVVIDGNKYIIVDLRADNGGRETIVNVNDVIAVTVRKELVICGYHTLRVDFYGEDVGALTFSDAGIEHGAILNCIIGTEFDDVLDDFVRLNPHMTKKKLLMKADFQYDTSGHPTLRSWILEYQKIQQLPENMSRIPMIGTLHLGNNRLHTLPEDFGHFIIGGSLTLECNPLRTLPESFGCLRVGEDISLSNNHLVALPESFGDLQLGGKVVRVGEGTNAHIFVPVESEAWSLSHLDLRSNYLQTLPESIGRLHVPGELNLSANLLQCVPPSFANITIGGDLSLGATHHWLATADRPVGPQPVVGDEASMTIVRSSNIAGNVNVEDHYW